MTSQKISLLFPGQGAQSVGMGRDFAESFPIAQQTIEEAEDILKRSLRPLLFEGPASLLTETRNSQVAIYVVSVAIWRVLQQQFPSLQPYAAAGLSLGEYTALTVTGRIPFELALSLVQYRGECMHAACEATPGTMAAIFGLPSEKVSEMVKELNLPHDLWVANFNAPDQTVISGTLAGVEKGAAEAKVRGARRAIPLKVHGAFHSGLMISAQQQLAEPIHATPIQESGIGLVMNVTGSKVNTAQEIRENMIKQVTAPVRWVESLQSLSDSEAFWEIGPGQVLTGLNKQIKDLAPTYNLSSVASLNQLLSSL